MSRYRLLAKAVAILDLVLCTISMLGVIALVILAGTNSSSNQNLEDQVQQIFGVGVGHPLDADAAVWVLCVVAAIWATITVLQIWTAFRLLSATEMGRDRDREASRFASTWWNVSVVLLLLETIGFLVQGMYVSFAINLVLRGVMICVVFPYLMELNK